MFPFGRFPGFEQGIEKPSGAFGSRNTILKSMPLTIGWPEISLRLALTVVAGILIGVNRSEHGHAAGLRTTLLVCLAASVSMLQVNLLLPMTGKTSGSFAVMDLMRLPLGILSGMGFIGAGAIVRKDSLVHGLTTAATLWFVTVLGLCFGGGQLALGLVGLALGVVVLEGLETDGESMETRPSRAAEPDRGCRRSDRRGAYFSVASRRI